MPQTKPNQNQTFILSAHVNLQHSDIFFSCAIIVLLQSLNLHSYCTRSLKTLTQSLTTLGYSLHRTITAFRQSMHSRLMIMQYDGFMKSVLIQCNPDIRDTDIRYILSGPKSKPVLPKQNRPKPDIRDFISGPDNSLISGLHCTFYLKCFGKNTGFCKCNTLYTHQICPCSIKNLSQKWNVRTWKTVREIQRCSFILNQKKSSKGTLINGKHAGICVLDFF